MPPKTFKQYYDEDPDFKARHKAYISQHTNCECGCSIVRSNMSKHKKSDKHKKRMEKQAEELNITEEQYKKLVEKIKRDLSIK
jgi:hypothetical protein